MRTATHHPDRGGAAGAGFTLLELIIAVTLLAVFVLPMFEVLTASRVRAIRYTQARQVKSLAQQKLHDRINFVIEEDEGTFEDEGHKDWNWIIDPPQPRSQGEQVVLEYTINVEVPIQIEGAANDSGGSDQFGNGSSYQYTIWTFPNEAWYEEQEYLFDNGMESLLYGDPNYTNEGLPAANTGAGR
ncbi:MAG: prepilin-type N-terminal cleavage/methylation domain-containing protein [Planctomycetota bacterium]|nr:prepilin-type N-terminal cleavage/methylation domain-containing protein [Planctomycetota bacterium]MEC9031893.1 prepilin-type N-terminal cleavage/methylation domain-containing protein [Planctomycetota bacterium]MEE3297442.1 prepilin-type N-terminal cleavage/methylation domain-containing protein [Planctomycetota bacterium]